MVFHQHDQTPVALDCRNSFRHGPGLEGAIDFQAEIITQPAGGVFLNDKRRLSAARRPRFASRRFVRV
jgi:hypothetical protein